MDDRNRTLSRTTSEETESSPRRNPFLLPSSAKSSRKKNRERSQMAKMSTMSATTTTGNGHNIRDGSPAASGSRNVSAGVQHNRSSLRGIAGFFGVKKNSNRPQAPSTASEDIEIGNRVSTPLPRRPEEDTIEIDEDSVISDGNDHRRHGADLVGEPNAIPIAVLPKICSVDSITRELEELAQNRQAREALVEAAFAQDEQTVKNLLGNVTTRISPSSLENFELNLTLLIAAWTGHASLLQYLVSCGVDLTTTDSVGRTALHLAALSGNPETVSILVRAGAPVNVWDKEQPVTPLCCAASAGSLECVKILVDNGAAIEFGSEPNVVSALHHAVLVNAVDCVRYLVSKKANVNFGQVFNETPVHIASAEGYVECLKILLDNGGNVVLKGSLGMTPLHLAAKDGAHEIVNLLIEAGSDVNALNSLNRTPLHLAALSQSLDCVEALLKAKADPNAQDVDLKTPLHSAIVKAARNFDCVKAILDAHGDPNKQDNSGFTPLHLAVINEFSPCVQLLLERGGDVTIKTNGGRSVLTYMVRKTPDTIGKLREMFNQGVTLNDEVNDREVELHFNFKVLKPSTNDKHEMLLFMNLIQAGQRRLLNHPLCESFLHLKWEKIRKFFLFNLFFYAAFVIILSTFVMQVFREQCMEQPAACERRRIQFRTGDLVGENCSQHCSNKKLSKPEERLAYLQSPERSVVWYLMVFFAFVLLAKELFQVVQNFREYFRTVENLLQISILIFVIFLVNLYYEKDDYYLPAWKYHVAAFAIFLAWVELMFLIGRFPSYGLYIQMFIIVLKDFTQFFIAYFAIIVAFALSFAVLFSRHDMFQDPGISILTTIVMMTGEFEYHDAIFFREGKSDGTSNKQGDTTLELEFPGSSHFLFLLFLLIMAIIMMNLLVGMAVNDIQGLQKTAKLERLVRQTELIAHIESTILSHLFSFLPTKLTKVLQNAALLVPESYRWSLYIRCNDPRDKRLPRDIVDAAYRLAKQSKEANAREYRPVGGKFVRNRCFLDRSTPGQRSGYAAGTPGSVPPEMVWTDESSEQMEQIKHMISSLQLDKEYWERKVEETEEAVLQMKKQFTPLINEILELLQEQRRGGSTAAGRRSRDSRVRRHSSEDDDEEDDEDRTHSATATLVDHSTLSSQISSLSRSSESQPLTRPSRGNNLLPE